MSITNVTTETVQPPAGYVWCELPGTDPFLRPDMAYLGEMLSQIYGFNVIPGAPLRIRYRGMTWVLTDNGGEIHVCNEEGDTHAAIDPPYMQNRVRVPIGRLAWFCAMTLFHGRVRDYGPNPMVDHMVLPAAARPMLPLVLLSHVLADVRDGLPVESAMELARTRGSLTDAEWDTIESKAHDLVAHIFTEKASAARIRAKAVRNR